MDITAYKQTHNAVIAAHTYQSPAVQAYADILGDSFALAQQAAVCTADTVFLCGVRFMAEGVKILCPEKRVVLVEPTADCPMARQISPARVIAFREQHPTYAVVAYINTTAELKAVCDVCVTSSSAVKIVRALPQENILFIPDKNLGAYVRGQVPEKHIVTWDGYCPVHDTLTAEDVLAARAAHPVAKVAMHPECTPEALACADMIGSTAAIISYIQGTDEEVLVATERGVTDKLSLLYPGRLHQICPKKMVCPDMKRTTVESIEAAMGGFGGEEIVMDAARMNAARHALVRMIEWG